MIDLDRPAPAPRTARPAPARALVLVAVWSLLAGVVLGGVATYFVGYRPLAASAERADRAGRSAVSVLIFTEPSLTTVHSEQRRIRVEAQVMVVNAGPEPIAVLAVRVDQPGVTVRSPERERQVAPGTAFPVDVVVEWDCATEKPAALAASVSVETADERVRTIFPVAVRGTPWIDDSRGDCAGLG
ncbi:hypothetical protein ACIBSW_22520 [Actinoplanes sp. NPDC049668]|uniref:hypothetical protein n=1 Tax=unclassified Actinoplanes TaxID=2626549 RepID=UPI0033A2FF8A